MNARRCGKAAIGGVLCLFLALLVRCDGNGPSETVVLEIGGEWIEITTVVSDECELDLPPTFTTNVTIVPSGDQISFIFRAQDSEDLISTGTWNSRTGQFSVGVTQTAGVFTITAVQSGTFTSESNYASESTIVITDGVESCTVRTTETGQRTA